MNADAGTDGLTVPSPKNNRRPLALGFGLIALGIAALFVFSAVEGQWLRDEPWGRAIRTEGYIIEDAGAIASWSRELPLSESVGDSEIVRTIQRDLIAMAALETGQEADDGGDSESSANPFDTRQMLDLSYLPRAQIVMLDMAAEAFEPLLESGRLPVAGQREVLAGPLTGSNATVSLDGEAFTVVGHLDASVAGFIKTYVLPADPSMRPFFSEEAGATPGTLYVLTDEDPAALIPELAAGSEEAIPMIHGRPVQTMRLVSWGVWLSLIFVAAGASLAFITFYRWLAGVRIPVLRTAMQETVLRPGLIVGLHLFFFSAFFGAMALGMRDAELNYFFTEYMAHTFTEGGLAYVGDAYRSGDIPRAAHATFFNNYVMQTLLLTVAISIPPFFLGVVKTFASLVVVGFAMAPIWSDTASGMTYHAITLALELPPYILASFGVIVWTLYLLQFLWSPVRVWYLGEAAAGEPIIEDAVRQLPRGLLVLVGCALVSGVFLYVAAWYEAITLILLR